MIIDEDEFLEHYGKKGMKWGERRTARFQTKKLDPARRVASGTGSKRDQRLARYETRTIMDVVRRRSVQETSRRALDQTAALQTRIAAGERRVTGFLINSGGINIANLDYSYTR